LKFVRGGNGERNELPRGSLTGTLTLATVFFRVFEVLSGFDAHLMGLACRFTQQIKFMLCEQTTSDFPP